MSNKSKPGEKFVRNFIVTFLCLISFVFLFTVVVDPYDNFHVSPPIARGVIAHNQRLSYPALAKSDRFDSAIFGTSTTRMINPTHINAGLAAQFVNLSLNSGTWWEQREMFRLFVRHHAQLKRIVFGIDVIWCQENDRGAKLTPRLFPPWLYDGNPWNDYLHVLNFKTVETAFEQLVHVIGIDDRSRYGRDGYRTLNKKGTPYDLRRARINIYGQATPMAPAKLVSPPQVSAKQRAKWTYPNIATLDQMLAKLPDGSQKLLIFVPYHHRRLGAPGKRTMLRYGECKNRVRTLKQKHANLKVMDFMYRSEFTLNDANYWDKLHFNEQAALRVEQAIVDYWTRDVVDTRYFKPL